MVTDMTRSFPTSLVWWMLALPGLAVAGESSLQQIELDGVTLNADLVSEPGVRRPVFLLVHGTLAHKDMALIETLQEALDEAGQDSLAISLSLGVDDRNGPLDCSEYHQHRQEDALAEIGAWLDWLHDQGYTKVSLIGHSRGAALAGQFALKFPARVHHTSLIAPPARFRLFHKDFDRLIASEIERFEGIEFLYCESASVTRESFTSYYTSSEDEDLRHLLEAVETDVLVITGTEDAIAGSTPEALMGIENRSVSMVEIDGADHFFHDLYAYDVVDAILDDVNRAPAIPLAESLFSLRNESLAQGLPTILFVTEPGCPYCHELRRQVLFPMLRAGELQEIALIREVSAHATFEFIDVNGGVVDGASFAKTMGVFALPTLMFIGPTGEELADRMVGIANLEMYEFFLKASIETATRQIEERPAN